MTEGNAKTGGAAIRVALPFHLRALARIEGAEVSLEVLEARYPMLAGTIREHGTGKRRAFMRIFACEEDWSHESLDAELPEAVALGKEPLLILGAIAGGNDRDQGPGTRE